MPEMKIGSRLVGPDHPPLVVAEIGINHEGSVAKARQMVWDAYTAGAECVKFQCHIPADEMIRNGVVPANADVSIWDIVSRCTLSEDDERGLQRLTESLGMIYLSTPFGRAAALRLQSMGVPAFKIGSGEANNLPLVRMIAGFGKPVILSTGMHSIESVRPAVGMLRAAGVPYALMHCTSMYPTPYDCVRLGALGELGRAYPDAVLGLSDHSASTYPALGAVALGASIIERHFTSSRSWPGPDIPISDTPDDLRGLVLGARAIWEARGGTKAPLSAEQPTIDFAFSSVVTVAPVRAGERFSEANVWVKRPGGGIPAAHLDDVIGRVASRDIEADEQLSWKDVVT